MSAHTNTQENKSAQASYHAAHREKRNVFVRDLLHNYCLVYQTLMEQSERFAHSGTISYAVLNELLGEPMRKGVFWLFKDIAHHLFRTKSRQHGMPTAADSAKFCAASCEKSYAKMSLAQHLEHRGAAYSMQTTLEHTLDWCIGYAFHECAKLREDAFQRQHYTNRLTQIRSLSADYAYLTECLHPLTQHTHESIARELARILSVFDHMRTLFLHLLPLYENNDHIARLIITKRPLLHSCFHEHWDEFMHALYGEKESALFLCAARSFLQSGRHKKAHALLEKAKHTGASAQEIELIFSHSQQHPPHHLQGRA